MRKLHGGLPLLALLIGLALVGSACGGDVGLFAPDTGTATLTGTWRGQVAGIVNGLPDTVFVSLTLAESTDTHSLSGQGSWTPQTGTPWNATLTSGGVHADSVQFTASNATGWGGFFEGRLLDRNTLAGTMTNAMTARDSMRVSRSQ